MKQTPARGHWLPAVIGSVLCLSAAQQTFAQGSPAPVKGTLTVNMTETKPISDMLFGIFFEDINYAADGGLYAELVRNRDFEFSRADAPDWNSKSFWRIDGPGLKFEIGQTNPISKANPNYAVLTTENPGACLINEGYSGYNYNMGAKYDFSAFVRSPDGTAQTLELVLRSDNGRRLGSTEVKFSNKEWKKITAVLTSDADCAYGEFFLYPKTAGTMELDMVSLFPQDTFKGRKNGLRKDLAQTLADLKPRFVRFPGGCVAHGDRWQEDGYLWKESVGALEDRKPIRNRWGYHQTRGLGYFEYMQFCEDIGAEPLPILPAGVDCQFNGGGQKLVPMDQMQRYVDDALDLVEFANGPASSKWGALRAKMGHPKPFNLKYVGIGNEEQLSQGFQERFKMINDAMKAKYPEIKVVGTAGPYAGGGDFDLGWQLARKENVPIVDEHFYQGPDWFVRDSQHRYDNYDRKGPKVYAGEYAAHEHTRRNTIETALDEALFLTGVERNGDVVVMSSYAPLLAKSEHTQWVPDMIYFTNTDVNLTTTYEVQKLFGQNAGVKYVSNKLDFSGALEGENALKTAASVVQDKNGDTIIKVVNTLPSALALDVSLNGASPASTAKSITISGKWFSTKYKLDEKRIKAGSQFKLTVQPYSMTVIRIPAK